MKILSTNPRQTTVYVARKPKDMSDLREIFDHYKTRDVDVAEILVTRRVLLPVNEFEDVASGFLADSNLAKRCTDMLREDSARIQRDHPELMKFSRFIEVRSSQTDCSFLVDTQGYDYCRYVALEIPPKTPAHT